MNILSVVCSGQPVHSDVTPVLTGLTRLSVMTPTLPTTASPAVSSGLHCTGGVIVSYLVSRDEL